MTHEEVVHMETYKKLLADKDKEIEGLKAWKESALSVWPDMQAIGKAIGVGLGKSIHDKILPAIQQLQSQLAAKEKEIEGLKAAFENNKGQLMELASHAQDLTTERDHYKALAEAAGRLLDSITGRDISVNTDIETEYQSLKQQTDKP